MIPIIGVVGFSGTGKTTLIVKLIKELKLRGYEIAAIKHTAHRVEPDPEGKDTRLLHQAGAKAVSLCSDRLVAVYMDTEQQWMPDEIVARLFPEADLVLAEGFSRASIPKIAVLGKDKQIKPDARKGLIAVVTEGKADAGVPEFSPEDAGKIADLLEAYIQRLRGKRDVRLFVNEKGVFIKPFIKDLFLKTVAAMVDSLKGTGGASRIVISIDKPGGEAAEEDN